MTAVEVVSQSAAVWLMLSGANMQEAKLFRHDDWPGQASSTLAWMRWLSLPGLSRSQ